MEIKQLLENTLRKEPNYLTDDGEIKKWVIISKAQNFDETLISLLLSEPQLKSEFFREIRQHWIFDINRFVEFVEQKEYLADSFTRYKNKIGLHIGKKYLNQINEVSLVWPYKDCILEGGQSREEQKRNEIFFNELLAQDEITQLLEPKAITNISRYTTDGACSVSAFNHNEQGTITDNLLIKGNNLLALHSLKKQFAGKIKLIYIDPPYNTGNDGFKYNDSFNHSTWLTFMKNRLEIAKKLLREDGFIFIHTDDTELGHLKIIMDEIFGRQNFRNYILTRRYDKNLNNQFIENGLKTLNIGADYVTIYGKSGESLLNPIYREASEKRSNNGYWKGFWNSPDRPTMRYEILDVNIEFGQWKWEKDKALEAVNNFKEYISHYSTQYTLEEYWIKTGKTKKIIKRKTNSTGKNKGIEHWIPPSDGILRNSNWTDILTSGTLSGFDFKNPKSDKLISELVKLGSEENDIILDFFAGSGTTAQAVLDLNKEDGGNRQFILCEQMDYAETITSERIKKVIEKNQESSFIYLELKKYNETFIEQIQEAQSTEALLEIWEAMKQRSFLNYNIDIKAQDASIEEFKQLSIEQQKQHLAELLDKNQLYVPLSAMNDEIYGVTAEEKAVTKAFYNL